MRKLLIGLFIAVAIFVAGFLLSPWPSVFVIRAIFDSGAAEASAKLEKRLPRAIQTETRQYDLTDADAFLDIHRPKSVLPGTPTIVWVHCGGFVSGRRSDLTNYTKILAGQGFLVVNVDYTIAPDAKYPTPVRQVNKALGYISHNAQALGVDADHIVLAGDIAGAQIVSQARRSVSRSAPKAGSAGRAWGSRRWAAGSAARLAGSTRLAGRLRVLSGGLRTRRSAALPAAF
ncbi:alpha/beta hydrolase [Sphingopyxis terrae subsp. ummariensis]